MLVLTAIVIAVLSGVVGARIGNRTRSAESGFIWGFMLGPIGWLFPASWLLARSQRARRIPS